MPKYNMASDSWTEKHIQTISFPDDEDPNDDSLFFSDDYPEDSLPTPPPPPLPDVTSAVDWLKVSNYQWRDIFRVKNSSELERLLDASFDDLVASKLCHPIGMPSREAILDEITEIIAATPASLASELASLSSASGTGTQ